MNKRTLFFSAVMIALIALLYAAFGPAENTAEAKSMPIGTIKVCWGQTCASEAVTTIVTLLYNNRRFPNGHILFYLPQANRRK